MVFEAVGVAVSTIFSWPVVVLLVTGIGVGFVFGVIPGLGGTVALALLTPITFGFSPEEAVVLLSAALGGVAFGGSLTAIMMNIPGTAPNAATCLDGYPMAKKGQANTAIGVSATASALGAVIGLLIIIVLIQFAKTVLLSFGPPEFFAVTVTGLAIIAKVDQGYLMRSIASGLFGFMLSFIGFSGLFSVYRYGFDTDYLWGGVPLIPTLIGLFAIAEVARYSLEGGQIVEADIPLSDTSALDGVKKTVARPGLLVRSSVIGTAVGMIPAAGGVLANFASYTQAKETSKNPEAFGEGAIEGIIASEAANDAKDGGSILPTVAFGIPGSLPMVVLLSAFLLHGITPGVSMFTENVHVLFIILITLAISNIVVSLVGIASAERLAVFTRLPVKQIVPAILVLSLIGSYAIRTQMGDVLLTVAVGILGFGMVVYHFSRIAFMLGLILGPIAERYFIQSLDIYEAGYWIFFQRPISLLFIVVALLILFSPIIRPVIRTESNPD